MTFIKIENGVVVQKQPNAQTGFIEFNSPVVCGQLYTAVEGEEGTVANPVPSAQQVRDSTMQQLKQIRERDLLNIEHDFLDGRIVQARPDDLAIFQLAIGTGVSKEWVLKNNTIGILSVVEMQIAVSSGIAQGEAIWQTYIDQLKLL